MTRGGRRVAVTGLGVVAPAGIGVDNFWSGLLGPGTTGGVSSEIDDWDPSPYFDSPKHARRADRVEQFALALGHLRQHVALADVLVVGLSDTDAHA